MKTIIANPIYDVVFKNMMENEQVSKILLSALLKCQILELKPGRNEFSNTLNKNVSLYRIDFSARIIDAYGEEKQITIEVQKTWGSLELLRFRQYLGKQYMAAENVRPLKDKSTNGRYGYYGIPMVTIYLLGHTLGDMDESVVYINRKYMNYEGHELSYNDRFIESITHESIVVQIPLLQRRARNYVERILQVFDQRNIIRKDNSHTLELSDDDFVEEKDLAPIIRCLNKIASDPDVREIMDAEDIYLAEMEMKNNELLIKDKEIAQRNKVIEQKEQELEQNKQALEQNKQALEQKDQALEQKDQELEELRKQLNKLQNEQRPS